MDLIKILAEDYGNGSKGTDFLSVQDGSETLQDITNNTESPSNTDSGAGQVKDTAQNRPDTNSEQGESAIAGHIKTEDTFPGRDINKSEDPNRKKVSILDDPDKDEELNTANSANYTTTTYPIDGVDNNHSDGGLGIGGFTASLLNIFQKATGDKRQQEQNFFLQNSTNGGVADSPEILNDGHAPEELVMQERTTVNNPLPGVNDTSVFTDSSAFDFDRKPGDIPTEDRMDRKREQNISEIDKGKGVWAHLTYRPSMISHIPFAKKATGEWQSAYQDVGEYAPPSGETNVPQIMHKDDEQNRRDEQQDEHNESNVEQIMDPDEQRFKHDRVKEDFGTKDETGRTETMGLSPLLTDSNPESQNYSGVNGTASLLDIIMKKEAYGYAPVGLMPNSNPNSGNDENDTDDNDDEIYGTIQPHRPMTDGKPSYVFDNQADKEVDETLSDGAGQMRKRKYNRTEDSDKQDYYGFSGSGSGGMGGEGDGTFSGINNSD